MCVCELRFYLLCAPICLPATALGVVQKNKRTDTTKAFKRMYNTTMLQPQLHLLLLCLFVLLCCCVADIANHFILLFREGVYIPPPLLYPQRKWKSPKTKRKAAKCWVGSYCYRLNPVISFKNRCIVWGILAYVKNILGNLMKIIIITELKQQLVVSSHLCVRDNTLVSLKR